MESSEEDLRKYGLRIYTIIKNGPLDKGGANELTDFIIPPAEIFTKKINFEEWVKSHSNQEITLSLYSLLTKKFRDIKIITNPIGSKDGILGASVRKENWTIANKNVLHIISVEENSFAQKELGLIPLEDYIVGIKLKGSPIIPLNQDDFSPLEILGEVIRKNKGKLMKFYIYNKNKGSRDITVTIGSDYYFTLGCEGAFGALHMFPSLEVKENKIEQNIEATEKLIKEIKESINDIKQDNNIKNDKDNSNNIENENIKNKEEKQNNNINVKINENQNISNDSKSKNIEKEIDNNTDVLPNEKKEKERKEIQIPQVENFNKIAEEISVQKEIENQIEKEESTIEKEKNKIEEPNVDNIDKKEINEEHIIETKEEQKIEEIKPENLLENQIKYKQEDNENKELIKENEEQKEEKKEDPKEEDKNEEKKNEENKKEEIKEEEGEKEEEIIEEEIKENETKNEENKNNNTSSNKNKKKKKRNKH